MAHIVESWLSLKTLGLSGITPEHPSWSTPLQKTKYATVWLWCRGLVPAQHVAGLGRKGWPKAGQKVSVRVLECDAGSRRLMLTMKRLLLEEKLAPFASWEVSLCVACLVVI